MLPANWSVPATSASIDSVVLPAMPTWVAAPSTLSVNVSSAPSPSRSSKNVTVNASSVAPPRLVIAAEAVPDTDSVLPSSAGGTTDSTTTSGGSTTTTVTSSDAVITESDAVRRRTYVPSPGNVAVEICALVGESSTPGGPDTWVQAAVSVPEVGTPSSVIEPNSTVWFAGALTTRSGPASAVGAMLTVTTVRSSDVWSSSVA